MNDVWVVISGTYPEEAEIAGVFSSEAKAAAYIDYQCSPERGSPAWRSWFSVERWPVDPSLDA